MRALILAGGIGSRLQQIVKDLPKPMAPVAGRPFLEYLIFQLLKWKIKEIVLSVGYKKDIIKSYFSEGEKWNTKIIYSEEDEPLGTGGAIKKAFRLIDDEQFLIMNGDSFLDLNFVQFISYHKSKYANITISLAYVDNVSRYGRVETNENGKVIRFVEKSYDGPGFINGGIYIFNREIVSQIPDGKVSLEDEIFPLLINQGLYGFSSKGYFVDLGIPQDYLKLCNNPESLPSPS